MWLVVMGVPKEHTSGGMGMGMSFRRRGRGRSGGGGGGQTEWPYQIKLTGTTLDDSVIE